jgi:hypothetical protein
MSWVEQRKHGCRIQDYTQHGMRTVTLENRALRVTVLPDKGAARFSVLLAPCARLFL